MTNITITSTTNSIIVNFNDYYPSAISFSKGCWRKDKVLSFELSSVIIVHIQGERDWLVSHDGSGGSFQVDTVDGVSPSSLSDLYDKLCALIT